MAAVSMNRPQNLRVAAVWGTTVVTLKVLERGQSFELGDGATAAMPMPDGLEMSPAPVRAAQGGWELDPRGAIGGVLRLRGRQEDPVHLAKIGHPIAVMPGDYGLLQYGQFAVFFQYSTPAEPIKGGAFGIELLALLALFSSTVFHIGVLGMLRTLMTPPPLSKPLELTNPDEYAARFGLHRAMIEEPPPPVTQGPEQGGSGVKDPGAQDKKPQGGGQKMPDKEGKLGLKGSEKDTQLPGEIRPAQKLGGLSDVLNDEAGEEIKHTLKTIDTVATALSGLNSQNLVLGAGPGTSLKGAGAGGGGSRDGVAFGSGTLNTGWGPGRGGGYGAGTGGPGGRGGGGAGMGGNGGGTGTGNGRGAGGPGERTIGVAPGSGRSSGGLSPEQVRRVVMSHTGALRACYETEAQRNPNLAGGVTVVWQIDPSGSVTSASVASTTLNNARVEGCVVRQVRMWHFPQSDSATRVDAYPFKFAVGG
jgi:hypothetical protein